MRWWLDEPLTWNRNWNDREGLLEVVQEIVAEVSSHSPKEVGHNIPGLYCGVVGFGWLIARDLEPGGSGIPAAMLERSLQASSHATAYLARATNGMCECGGA